MNREQMGQKLAGTMFMIVGNTDEEKDFYLSGATYGYSLAEAEIERLKKLLKNLYCDYGYYRRTYLQEEWEQFCETNKL